VDWVGVGENLCSLAEARAKCLKPSSTPTHTNHLGENMGVCLEENKFACPLREESIDVPKNIIEFLERHNYVDVIKNGVYLFTLKRLEKGQA